MHVPSLSLLFPSLTPIYSKTVKVGEIMSLFFLNVLIPPAQRHFKNMSWSSAKFSTPFFSKCQI